MYLGVCLRAAKAVRGRGGRGESGEEMVVGGQEGGGANRQGGESLIPLGHAADCGVGWLVQIAMVLAQACQHRLNAALQPCLDGLWCAGQYNRH